MTPSPIEATGQAATFTQGPCHEGLEAFDPEIQYQRWSESSNHLDPSLPEGMFQGREKLPSGTFRGEEELPPGTFHGEEELPPGTFHGDEEPAAIGPRMHRSP